MNGELLHDTEAKMHAAVEALKKELATIRTGHATPALVEHVKVEYGGVPLPLNQLAGISAPAARLLLIQPWDKNSLHSIEKAILKSDLGLNPTSDGTQSGSTSRPSVKSDGRNWSRWCGLESKKKR